MPIKYLYYHPPELEGGLKTKLKAGLKSEIEPTLEATPELILNEYSSHNYPWHFHLQHCVVSLVLEGEASLGIANNATNKQNQTSILFLNLRKGQYFIIPVGQKHCLNLLPSSQLLSICLPIGKSKTEHLNDVDFVCQKLNLLPNFQKISQKLKNIIASQNWSEAQQPPIEQAQRLFGDHAPDKLNLKRMAMLAGYSPWHFLRLFRKQMGLTPHAYLLARKLSLARHLLRKQPDQIAKTAQEAGFYDQSHMCKLLKQHHGLTPREFQKASFKITAQEP